MANLKATSFSGSVFEKLISVTPSTTDMINDPFNGSSEASLNDGHSAGVDWIVTTPRVIAYNPHRANQFVVIYSELSGNAKLYAKLGLVQGRSITWQDTKKVNPASWGGQADTNHVFIQPMIAFDQFTPNQFVVVYRKTSTSRWYAAAGDCSGDVLSFGYCDLDEQEYGGGNNQHAQIGDIKGDPNVAGRFTVVGYEPYLQANGGWNSSLTVTTRGGSGYEHNKVHLAFGTGVPGSGSWVWHQTSHAFDNRIAYDPHTTGRYVVVWRDGTDNNKIKARIYDLGASGTTQTAASAGIQQITATESTYPDVAWDPDQANKILFSYTRHDGQGVAGVGTVTQGTGAIAMGTTRTFSGVAATGSISFLPGMANKFVIAYEETATNLGKWRIGTRDLTGSANTLLDYTPASAVTFNATTSVTHASIACDPNRKGKFVIASIETSVFGKVIMGKLNSNVITIDLTTGNYFTVDLDQNSFIGDIDTITVTGATGSNIVHSFVLKVIQGPIAKQIDWDGLPTFKWNRHWIPGTGWVHRPTMTTTNNAVDVYSFTTYDNGSTWYSSIVGQDIKATP